MTDPKTLTAEQRIEQRYALDMLIDTAWEQYLDTKNLTRDEIEIRYPHTLSENDKAKDLRHCQYVVRRYLRDRIRALEAKLASI